MNILSYLNGLRPAIPYSVEQPGTVMSNGELRRCLANKAIIINGETDWKWDEEAPDWVWQLIFFPKSTKGKPASPGKKAQPPRRTTLVQYDFPTHSND